MRKKQVQLNKNTDGVSKRSLIRKFSLAHRLGKNTRYRVSIRYCCLYRKVSYRSEKYRYSKKYGPIGTSGLVVQGPATRAPDLGSVNTRQIRV